MDVALKDFILQDSFPCIMARAVMRKGHVKFHQVEDIRQSSAVSDVMKEIYQFIDVYRQQPDKLSSFILSIKHPDHLSFAEFQQAFWQFLKEMREKDAEVYAHDPRVAADPNAADFSYSLKEEAFFILTLHPESNRFARRFKTPTIVFNPHQQFEQLRQKGLFTRIQKLIRLKDKALQGSINPMLKNFGERSEVFQYLGVEYQPEAVSPL